MENNNNQDNPFRTQYQIVLVELIQHYYANHNHNYDYNHNHNYNNAQNFQGAYVLPVGVAPQAEE